MKSALQLTWTNRVIKTSLKLLMLVAFTFTSFATNSNGTVYGSEVSQSITVIDLSTLGCITIVASGGAAEGTSWTYSNGTILPNSATNVNLNASDVLAKMALGDLALAAKCITIDADVNYTENNNNLTRWV